jgi:ABC-type Na+ efflux pump permease subunit
LPKKIVMVGILGTTSAAAVAMVTGLPVTSAVLCFVGISTGVAIADVTIDACIAKNSIDKPALAPDMQSLCAFSSSLGALLGYATSGMFIHHFGAQVNQSPNLDFFLKKSQFSSVA